MPSRVTAIGQYAKEIIHTHSTARVTGTTKRGIFLQAEDAMAIFLSDDPFRSPITINIRVEDDQFFSVQPEDAVELSADRIFFPANNFSLKIKSPLVWKPPKPPTYRKLKPLQLVNLYKQAHSLIGDHPYLSLLEMIVADFPPPVEDLGGVEKRIEPLSRATDIGDISEIYKKIRKLVGAGPGLTPLGDDILLGFLLAVKRSYRHYFWSGDQGYIGSKLVAIACMNTTALSWSLIKCAAEGTGDERQIRVLDYLIAGKDVPDPALESLLEWGSSSGIGVLAGMVLVLSK